MSEEYVTIVDSENNVVGKEKRSVMRSKNLAHRGTGIFIFNSNGDLFVHKRSPTKDIFGGHYDVLVGGVVSSGESYEECAKREVAEELGIKNVKLTFLFDFLYSNDIDKTFIKVYTGTSDSKISLQKEEIEFGSFKSIDEIKEMIKTEKFCPDGIEIFNKYLKEYKDV